MPTPSPKRIVGFAKRREVDERAEGAGANEERIQKSIADCPRRGLNEQVGRSGCVNVPQICDGWGAMTGVQKVVKERLLCR